MDAVDPELIDQAERVLRDTGGVTGVDSVRMRWIGHALRAECEIAVADETTVVAAHEIAHTAEHNLIHAIPRLTAAIVHTGPHAAGGDSHEMLDHHR
jgi:divalent metal cation (Fe/Co/Zn/Cd) transporter